MLRAVRLPSPAPRALAAVLLLGVAACPAPRAPRGPAVGVGKGFTGCLPLAGTSRASLRLGPDGHYLYWTEQVRLHGSDDSWPSTEVVRWPIDGGPVEPLTSLVENPYRVLPDGRVLGLRKDAGVTLWTPSGSEVISSATNVEHMELLADQQAVVYLAYGAVWRQPLDREGASWLAAADSLLGVDGNTVITRGSDSDGGGHLYQVDAASGKETELPAQDDAVKAVTGALVTQSDAGVGVRPFGGGDVKTVLGGSGWDLKVGPDGVKAWRRVGPRLDGAIVSSAGAELMPPVMGGDSLEGFVRLPDGRIAYLIGHDLDGDQEVTTGDEVDVCLAAAGAHEVRVEPRTAPIRWRKAGAAIDAFVKDTLGGGTWHFASGDAVPGLYVVDAAVKRKDEAAIRDDVRKLAATVADTTGERTMFIDLTYADGRRGFSEWWSDTGRRITWAGMGGATVPDLADYDVTFKGQFDEVKPAAGSGSGDDGGGDGSDGDDGDLTHWRCRGTVTNHSNRTLVKLFADCVGGNDDRKIEVHPQELAPGQTGTFDEVVDRRGTNVLAVSIHTGGGFNEVPGFDEDRHLRYIALDKLAADIADRTDLVYKDTDAGSGTVTVKLAALPPVDHQARFSAWSGQAQEQAAAGAYELLDRANTSAPLDASGKTLLGGDKGDALVLRISDGERSWDYQDGHLTESSAEGE
ncbi:MAG TPA: hypothetical protein VHE35_06890 [Kofleriaceae bacterium]|nr:hypothetical protein [Kofleriaceae bacterium]